MLSYLSGRFLMSPLMALMLFGTIFFAAVPAGYAADDPGDAHLTMAELDFREPGEQYHKDNPVIPNQYEQNNVTTSKREARMIRTVARPFLYAGNAGLHVGYHYLQCAPAPLVNLVATGGALTSLLVGFVSTWATITGDDL